jgi:hypothetical protein
LKAALVQGLWGQVGQESNLHPAVWSTRRSVQGRLKLSNTALNSQFLAMHRLDSSKNVQALCSQLCSQLDLCPTADRRSLIKSNAPISSSYTTAIPAGATYIALEGESLTLMRSMPTGASTYWEEVVFESLTAPYPPFQDTIFKGCS